MSELEYTPRGFRVYARVTDSHGQQVQVQESSAADTHCVWVFCNDRDGTAGTLAPHLDLGQARAVRDALDAFVTDAEARKETP